MRFLVPILLLAGLPALAEPLQLKKSTVVKTDHGALIVSAGSVVEVVNRSPTLLQVIFKGEKGTIAIGSNAIDLAPDSGIDPSRPASKKVTPPPATPVAAASPAPAPASSAVTTANPQSFSGRVVKKAEGVVDQHQKNLVDPANAATNGDAK